MAESQPESHLPPVAGRAIRSGMVVLVVAAALVCGLAPSALWMRTTFAELRSHHDDAYPLLLEWNASRVRARLDTARLEIAAIARDFPVKAPGSAAEDSVVAALSAALRASETYSGLVLVDPAGQLITAVGSGPALESLVGTLEVGTALESQLADVMRAVELRKDLVAAKSASLQVLELPDLPPLVLAGAPLRSGRAFVHGLMAREAIGAELGGGRWRKAANLWLVDGQGRLTARGPSAEAAQPGAPAAGDGPMMRVLDALGSGWKLHYEHPLDAFGWTLVAEEPVLRSFRPVAIGLLQTGFATCVLTLGFGLLAFRRGTSLARPLWTLYESMRKAVRDPGSADVPLQGAEGEAESLIHAFNAMSQRVRKKRAESEQNQKALEEQNYAFQKKHKALSKLTVTDPLTKLANRRFLEDQMGREIKRLTRTREGLSMLVADIDDFKKLNDRFGHAAGDEFLKQVARILKESVRATDLVARFGGEEFVVLATGTDLDGAAILGEKLRMSVAEASFIVDETMRPRRATISVGVAQYRGSQTDLFNSADAALYRAKSAGKNCVKLARDDGEDDSV